MFVYFYSIQMKDKFLRITGYSEALEHYFDMKIKIISYETAMKIVSTEEKTVVKGNTKFYLIETNLFTQFIEPEIYQKFDYKKYNLPETVYMMIISLLTCRL
tara:strand:+ start:4506 stop:4811 length:306 start_codon:yes stop_codon:yes gene_type:complete